MNRSPAFQFYPDKWQSHTRRLSDSSYRVFHELMCWMWQSSPDYCSIAARPEAVSVAIAMPIECVRIAMADIQNADAPLLKMERDRWVCHGLRKEAEKQGHRRMNAMKNANARWNHATASKQDATASISQCSSSSSLIPSSSPTPTPIPEDVKIAVPDKPDQPPAKKKSVKLASDAEWLSEIQKAYIALGIDVGVQAVKAKAWLSTNGRGRQFTRRFFVNWLNKCDKVLSPSSFPTNRESAYPIPENKDKWDGVS